MFKNKKRTAKKFCSVHLFNLIVCFGKKNSKIFSEIWEKNQKIIPASIFPKIQNFNVILFEKISVCSHRGLQISTTLGRQIWHHFDTSHFGNICSWTSEAIHISLPEDNLPSGWWSLCRCQVPHDTSRNNFEIGNRIPPNPPLNYFTITAWIFFSKNKNLPPNPPLNLERYMTILMFDRFSWTTDGRNPSFVRFWGGFGGIKKFGGGFGGMNFKKKILTFFRNYFGPKMRMVVLICKPRWSLFLKILR